MVLRYDTYVDFSRGISIMMIVVGILGLIGNTTAILVLSRWDNHDDIEDNFDNDDDSDEDFLSY